MRRAPASVLALAVSCSAADLDREATSPPKDVGPPLAAAMSFEAEPSSDDPLLRGAISWKFVLTGLPAVSAAGDRVLVATTATHCCAPIPPALTLEERDVDTGRVLRRWLVLSVTEGREAWRAPSESAGYAAIERRVRERVRAVQDLLASETWVPLAHVEPEYDWQSYPRRAIDVGRTRFVFDDLRLTVTRDGGEIFVQPLPTWARAPAGDETLPENPIAPRAYCLEASAPDIVAASLDEASRVAVVTVRYAAPSDSCDPLGPRVLAFRLP